MSKKSAPENTSPAKDAPDAALKREENTPENPPVRQHNPGGQGLNPDQKGPAQPDVPDDPGR